EALLRSQRDFRQLIEQCPDGVAIHRRGNWLYANHAFASCLGYERGGEVFADGLIEFEGAPAYLILTRDLTAHKKMEAQLYFADRLASVGTLAAGVAH